MRAARTATAATAILLLVPATGAVRAQELPPVGREVAEALAFPPLDFDPPEPEVHTLSRGVKVFHLRDDALPLVNLYARFRGGWARFPREHFAAGTALPNLLRNGGTERLPPDSVDALLEFHALQTSFGGGGESVFSSLNVLTGGLERGVELWGEMLRSPRFDPGRLEVWRGQQLERVRRRGDDPAVLAFTEFNRLMYGDHPVGWRMGPEDLALDKVTPERLLWLQRRVVCPENLVLGVAGNVPWRRIEPHLEGMLQAWPSCVEPLPPSTVPTIRSEPGIFLLPREVEQSIVVLAHPTDVRLGDTPSFFASRIANALLGASGFGSRLMTRLRTERGYVYGVSSLWTAHHERRGLVGAQTRTRSGTTVAATRLILEVMEEMRRRAPSPEDVQRSVDEIVNGFVFNFQSPARIVSRRVFFEAEGLPADWLERYLQGIQAVTPDAVHRAVREHLRPDEMTILILGDPDAFDASPEELGDVTVLPPSGPDAPPRSPR